LSVSGKPEKGKVTLSLTRGGGDARGGAEGWNSQSRNHKNEFAHWVLMTKKEKERGIKRKKGALSLNPQRREDRPCGVTERRGGRRGRRGAPSQGRGGGAVSHHSGLKEEGK